MHHQLESRPSFGRRQCCRPRLFDYHGGVGPAPGIFTRIQTLDRHAEEVALPSFLACMPSTSQCFPGKNQTEQQPAYTEDDQNFRNFHRRLLKASVEGPVSRSHVSAGPGAVVGGIVSSPLRAEFTARAGGAHPASGEFKCCRSATAMSIPLHFAAECWRHLARSGGKWSQHAEVRLRH